MQNQSKLIFHIDVNSAFLSWEAVYRKEVLGEVDDLRDIPSAIGGDQSKRHGIILAKSTAAKQYGIKTGESIHEALKKCPTLMVVPARMDIYQDYSKKFIKLLESFTPDVEQYSVDEAFCDMSGFEQLYGKPIDIGYMIKDAIKQQLGFTVNVGISSNRLLAKMASDFEKPDSVNTLFQEEVPEKMWPLPVRDLFFVGRKTAQKLNSLAIYTIGDLAKTDVAILRAHLKKHGDVIHDFANGIDSSDIEKEEVSNKSYGNGMTVSFDITSKDMAKKHLLLLSETVAGRLRKDEKNASVISVTICYFDFTKEAHQKTGFPPTNVTKEIANIAYQLFEEVWNQSPIRALRVCASKIVDEQEYRQISLFDVEKHDNHEKLKKADKAFDEIQKRFGKDAIKRAGLFVDELTQEKDIQEDGQI